MPTEEQVRRTSAVITAGTWVLTGAVVAASMSTAAPFVDAHSTGYLTGPVMVIGTDGCFILALQADSVLARFGADGGWWTRLFRWATGLSTVWLNIGHSALAKDLVGVAVHLIPPLLLLLVAEAGPAYRKALVQLARRARQHHQAPTLPEPEAAPWPLYTAASTAPEAVDPVSASPLPVLLPAVPVALEAAPAGPAGPVDGTTVHPASTVPATAPWWTPTTPAETHPAPAESIPVPAPEPSGVTVPDPVDAAVSTEPAEPSTADDPAAGEPSTEDESDDSEAPAPVRLSEDEAAAEIERCWRERVPLREAGRRATRAPSYVGRVYQRLNSEHAQAA